MARRIVFPAFVLACLGAPREGTTADWPQWRGPERDGVAPESPALAASWPEDGPPVVWEVEGIPSGGDGGYGSPVIAGGRVLLYVHWRFSVPLPTRVLSESGLRGLGWTPEPPPPDVLEALEAARESEEREGLRGQELREWIDAWVSGHLDEDGQKRHGSFVRRRLSEGVEAMDLEVLRKLATIRDREFEGAEDLDRWLAGAGIGGKARERVLSRVPAGVRKSKDVVLCLSAENGEERWRKEWPGSGSGSSSTVCVAGGRCYALTSTRDAVCLDAKTGNEIWRTPSGGGHSSFLVEGGLAIALADELSAFDATDGHLVWKQPAVRGRENSVVRWDAGGERFLLSNTKTDVACVELATGAVRWRAPGGGPSTVAASKVHLAILTDSNEKGLIAYRLSANAAVPLWRLPNVADRGASPILHDGRVYAVAGNRTLSVDVDTGEPVWDVSPGRGDVASPILADGKIIALLGGRSIALIDLEGNVLARARVSLAQCASPAFFSGRVVLRTRTGLACLDLRARPQRKR